MSRKSQYSEEQKTAILDAVKSGRKAGKKWPEILTDAESAGYKGGLQYLMKMARSAGAVRGRRGRKKVAAAGKVERPMGAAKRGPGRPKGTALRNGAGLGQIDAIVERMVKERLSAALARAVSSLEQATQELKSL